MALHHIFQGTTKIVLVLLENHTKNSIYYIHGSEHFIGRGSIFRQVRKTAKQMLANFFLIL